MRVICRIAVSSKPTSRSRAMSSRRELDRVARHPVDVVEHDVLGLRHGGRAMVFPDRLHQGVVERDPTQKLCV